MPAARPRAPRCARPETPRDFQSLDAGQHGHPGTRLSGRAEGGRVAARRIWFQRTPAHRHASRANACRPWRRRGDGFACAGQPRRNRLRHHVARGGCGRVLHARPGRRRAVAAAARDVPVQRASMHAAGFRRPRLDSFAVGGGRGPRTMGRRNGRTVTVPETRTITGSSPSPRRRHGQEFRPPADRIEVVRALGAGRLLQAVRPWRAVLDPAAAAQRHRHPAHGSRVPADPDGRAGPARADVGEEHAVAGRHRPRRHRHAEDRREPARGGRQVATRPQPREVRRTRVAVEAGIGFHHHPADAPAGRVGGLVARTLHDGRGPVGRGFVEWYRAGLIYRGNRLVNWDPVLMTAVSDLEVNSVERDGHLWSIRYDVIDPQPGAPDHVVIATTRPETMLGDVAVAVHPEDERYAKLIGKRLRLPITNREIPVIADDYVDREFGTGAVKVTPAHDFNDYAIGQRHGLDSINVLTLDAKVNDHAPAEYRGMDRY